MDDINYRKSKLHQPFLTFSSFKYSMNSSKSFRTPRMVKICF